MEKKQYDLMADMTANKNKSINDLVVSGLTAENTLLLDKDVYKNDEWIRSQYTDAEGNFKLAEFDSMYNLAKLNYNVLATLDYDKAVSASTVFDRNNGFVSPESRAQGVGFLEIDLANPTHVTSSLVRLGELGKLSKSVSELALANKVLLNPVEANADPSKAKWGDAPEGLFSTMKYFTDTLVLALYEDSGTHRNPVTGDTEAHLKGEYKLNSDGEYYYERLDGRTVYDKQVLNKLNTLTTEDSFLNQYDFFDSDDIELKSIIGSTMKNLALVGTMFLPYVGPYVTALSLSHQLAGLGATLTKMLVGNENATLNNLEGWAKSMNRLTATTEYAQQNAWCWENMINLIGDVAGQLKEQRFLFLYAPRLIKGRNAFDEKAMKALEKELGLKYDQMAGETIENAMKRDMAREGILLTTLDLQKIKSFKVASLLENFLKGYRTIGEVLGKGYMTGITVADTYGEAKNAGASDTEATLLTLGYAAAEYKLLSTGLGEWVMPELRASRVKHEAMINALKNIKLEASLVASTATTEGKRNLARKLFDTGKKIFNAEYATGKRTGKAMMAAAAGESFEETSEELLADFSKACFDTVNWLRGDDTRVNTFGYDFASGKWNSSEVFNRYAMSAVGGFIGGGLANAGMNYKEIKSYQNMTTLQALNELVYMVRNGEDESFVKTLRKSTVGNPNLSSEVELLDDGTFAQKVGTKDNNQDLDIKNSIIKEINLIKQILKANGADLPNGTFLTKLILGDMRFSALLQSNTAGSYLNTYNILGAKLAKLVSDYNEYLRSTRDVNGDGVTTDPENRHAGDPSDTLKAELKRLKDAIKQTQLEIQDLISGKRAYEFIADSLYELIAALSGRRSQTSFPFFVRAKTGKNLNELSDGEKLLLADEYRVWKTTEGRELTRIHSRLFREIDELASELITNHVNKYIDTDPYVAALSLFFDETYNISPLADDAMVLPWATQNIPNENIKTLEYLVKSVASEDEINALNALYTLANEVDSSAEVKAAKDALKAALDNKEDATVIEKLRKDVKAAEAKHRHDKGVEYTLKIFDIFATKGLAAILPIIDRGFIDTLTKDRLLQTFTTFQREASSELNDWIDIRDEALDNGGSTFSGGKEITEEKALEEVDKLTPLSNTFGEIINQLTPLSNSPMENNLNEFALQIGLELVNITEVIKRVDDLLYNNTKDLSKFDLGEDLGMALEQAILLVDMYHSAILAARKNAVGVNNLYGYNSTLNEIAGKIEGTYPKLAEIDSKIADVLANEAGLMLRRLESLLKIYLVATLQKLASADRVSVKKDILMYKKFRRIIEVPDELAAWNGFDALKAQILSQMKHHEEILSNGNLSLNADLKKELVKERLAFENAIYDFFQANKDKISDPKKLAEFIKHFNLYSRPKEILSEKLEDMDDISTLWWTVSRAALKADSFYHMLKESMGEDIAPLATQELAIYNNIALVVNLPMFLQFFNAYRYQLKNDWSTKSVDLRKEALKLVYKNPSLQLLDSLSTLVDNCFDFLPVVRYPNIALVEGIPGAGKSKAVFTVTRRILDKFYPERLEGAWLAHGIDGTKTIDGKYVNRAEELLLSVGFNPDKTKALTKTELMEAAVVNYTDHVDPTTKKCEIPTTAKTTNEDGETVNAASIDQTVDAPTILFIDEVSQFSVFDMDSLSKLAAEKGFVVIAAGDSDQNKFKSRVQSKGNEYINLELGRDMFPHSPKLGVSMRTDNRLKSLNTEKLLLYKQSGNDDELLALQYYEGEEGLFGDKILPKWSSQSVRNSRTKDLILEELEKLKRTRRNPNEKIGFVYNDPNTALALELLSDKYSDIIEPMMGISAQGGEALYYIIDLTMSEFDGDRDAYLDAVYTGMSRAELGSIIVMSSNDPNIIGEAVNQNIKESKNPEEIKKYSRNYKAILDEIVPAFVKPEILTELSESTSSEEEHSWKVGLNVVFRDQLVTIKGFDSDTKEYIVDVAGTETRIRLELLEAEGTIAIAAPDAIYKKSSKIVYNGKVYTVSDITPVDYVLRSAEDGSEITVNIKEINDNAKPYTIDPSAVPDSDYSDVVKDWIDNKDVISHTRVGDTIAILVNTDLGPVPFLYKDGNWEAIFGFDSEGNPIEGEIKLPNGAEIGEIVEILNALNNDLSFPYVGQFDEDTHKYFPSNFDDIAKFLSNIIERYASVTSDVIDLYKLDFISRFITDITPPDFYADDADRTDPQHNSGVITEAELKALVKALAGPAPANNALDSKELAAKGDVIGIRSLLYSHNVFELGIQLDADGNPIFDERERFTLLNGDMTVPRFDNVNGLINWEIANGIISDRSLVTKERINNDYVYYLAELHNLATHGESRLDIIDQAKALFKRWKMPLPDNSYVTFAFKSSPYMLDEGVDDSGFLGRKAFPTDKNKKERTLFNPATDSKSTECNNKNLVMIIGSPRTGHIIEIPILTLSSPFTLLQVKLDDKFVFGEMSERFLQMLKDPNYHRDGDLDKEVLLHNVSVDLQDEFETKPEFRDMVQLLRTFDLTSGAVVYLDGKQFETWTPRKDLLYLGPRVVTNKGDYDILEGRLFHAAQDNWMTLSDFAAQPTGFTSRGIYIIKKDSAHIKAGNPFILYSQDPSIRTDSAAMLRLQALEADETLEKTVIPVYVLPPKVDLGTYFENVMNIFLKIPGTQPIGDILTSYRMLKILMNDSSFKTLLVSKHPALGNKVIDFVESLMSEIDSNGIKGALHAKDLSLFGFGKKPVNVCYALDLILANTVYDTNTVLEASSGLINRHFSPDANALTVVSNILTAKGIDGVFYRTPIPKGTRNEYGFVLVNKGYLFNGLDFHINAKVDPVMFLADVSNIIDLVLRTLRTGNGQVYSDDNLYYARGMLRTPLRRRDPILQELDSIKLTIKDNVTDLELLGDLLKITASNPKTFRERAAGLINAHSSGLTAFVINNTLVIKAPIQQLLGSYRVIRDTNNNVTVTPEFNGVDRYLFKIETLTGIVYNAEYNPITGDLTIVLVTQDVQSGTDTVFNEDSFKLVQEASEGLEELAEEDLFDADIYPAVYDLIHAQDFAAFSLAIADWTYDSDDESELYISDGNIYYGKSALIKRLLDLSLDEDVVEVLKLLLQIENSKEEDPTCPIDIHSN